MAIGKINGISISGGGGGGGSDSISLFGTAVFNNSSTTYNFWSLYSNSDITSAQWYTQYIVPKDGQITSCVVSINNNRSATFGVFKNISLFSSPGTGTADYEHSITAIGTNQTYTFNLTSNSFVAGDRIGFALKADGTGTLGYCNFNMLYEFT